MTEAERIVEAIESLSICLSSGKRVARIKRMSYKYSYTDMRACTHHTQEKFLTATGHYGVILDTTDDGHIVVGWEDGQIQYCFPNEIWYFAWGGPTPQPKAIVPWERKAITELGIKLDSYGVPISS